MFEFLYAVLVAMTVLVVFVYLLPFVIYLCVKCAMLGYYEARKQFLKGKEE